MEAVSPKMMASFSSESLLDKKTVCFMLFVLVGKMVLPCNFPFMLVAV